MQVAAVLPKKMPTAKIRRKEYMSCLLYENVGYQETNVKVVVCGSEKNPSYILTQSLHLSCMRLKSLCFISDQNTSSGEGHLHFEESYYKNSIGNSGSLRQRHDYSAPT